MPASLHVSSKKRSRDEAAAASSSSSARAGRTTEAAPADPLQATIDEARKEYDETKRDAAHDAEFDKWAEEYRALMSQCGNVPKAQRSAEQQRKTGELFEQMLYFTSGCGSKEDIVSSVTDATVGALLGGRTKQRAPASAARSTVAPIASGSSGDAEDEDEDDEDDDEEASIRESLKLASKLPPRDACAFPRARRAFLRTTVLVALSPSDAASYTGLPVSDFEDAKLLDEAEASRLWQQIMQSDELAKEREAFQRWLQRVAAETAAQEDEEEECDQSEGDDVGESVSAAPSSGAGAGSYEAAAEQHEGEPPSKRAKPSEE